MSARRRRKSAAGPTAGQSQPGNDFDDLDDLGPMGWKSNRRIADSPRSLIAELRPRCTNPRNRSRKESKMPSPSRPARGRSRTSFRPCSGKRHTGVPAPASGSVQDRSGSVWSPCWCLLLVGGGVILFNSINRLPTGVRPGEGRGFSRSRASISPSCPPTPIWRAPITEGKNADTFRRGTQLLPVVELASSGGPAAIRVFFRNQRRRW